ncbi:hypothetical protein V1284_007520 [Nitrobacteraceae bacterium AZCC 2299]
MVMRGLSERYGSWKMIWIFRRCGCSVRRERSDISRPARRTPPEVRIDQAHDAARHGGFAGAAFADDAQRAALAQRQRDVLGGGDFAGFAEERALAIDLAEFVGFQHHRIEAFLNARCARHQARHRRQQVAGVVHGGRAQDAVERAGFHQPALTHHRDAVGDLGDHAHVMGDEQHRGAVILLQVADQGEDLLLGGDVERGGRLVGDQELGLQHQGHRDHDALALTAGQPMRKRSEDALHVGQPHLVHHFENPRAARGGIEIGVGAQHLVDLLADRDDGIERRHRLLEDHRHGGGAELSQTAVAGFQHILADQLDAAAGGFQRILRQQAHGGKRGHRFAGSAFADHAQGFALAHLQRNAVDDLLAGAGLADTDDKIIDFQNQRLGVHVRFHWLTHLPLSRCFMRGSSASRAASPIRLTDRIAIDSSRPGQKISDGLI